jgi:hypothetical protein
MKEGVRKGGGVELQNAHADSLRRRGTEEKDKMILSHIYIFKTGKRHLLFTFSAEGSLAVFRQLRLGVLQ